MIFSPNRQSALHAGTTGAFFLATLYALGPLNSKILGLSWFIFSLTGMIVARRMRATHDTPSAFAPIAGIWLTSCLISLLLQGICVAIWNEDILHTLNPQIRLLLPAIAVFALLRKRPFPPRFAMLTLDAVAIACCMAFMHTLYLTVFHPDILRESLATNAIPWAVATGFLPCLLLPMIPTVSGDIVRKWFWYGASLCGIGAVLLSQSRGALFVVPWCFLVVIWINLPGRYSLITRITGTTSVAALSSLLIFSLAWWAPGDKLRLHQISHDLVTLQTSSDYNTSIGARLYLWGMAWDDIRQSPWIGVGSEQRLHRIHHAGENESAEVYEKLGVIRTLGHAHNQYLHSAWDHGLLGLATFLTLLGGMLMMIWRLARIAPASAWQLAGVTAMHVTSSLTNVNFAHNYYVVALSLAVIVPVLCAGVPKLSARP